MKQTSVRLLCNATLYQLVLLKYPTERLPPDLYLAWKGGAKQYIIPHKKSLPGISFSWLRDTVFYEPVPTDDCSLSIAQQLVNLMSIPYAQDFLYNNCCLWLCRGNVLREK
jgi:hypothetical protein